MMTSYAYFLYYNLSFIKIKKRVDSFRQWRYIFNNPFH